MDFKKGDKVRCIDNTCGLQTYLVMNKVYTVLRGTYVSDGTKLCEVDCAYNSPIRAARFEKVTEDFMSESFKKIKNFIWGNRYIIYGILVILLIDSIIFDGKFRKKIQKVFGKLLDKFK